MAKRFTNTDKWKSPLLRGMEAPYKLLWLYLHDECDHAGVWQIDFAVAEIKIGEKLNKTKAEKFFNGFIIPCDNNQKWFIPEFIEFQYGDLNPLNKVHQSVINLLNKLGVIDEQHKPLPSPMHGAKDKDKEQDKDKDPDLKINLFDIFWKSYPRKEAKGDAEKAWKVINPNAETVGKMIKVVDAYKISEQWVKDKGQFIPLPATWLRAKRWEDEISAESKVTSYGSVEDDNFIPKRPEGHIDTRDDFYGTNRRS